MLLLFVLALVLARLEPLSSDSIDADWIWYTLSSTVACTSQSEMCAHLTHLVFWARPTDPTKLFTGAGSVRFSKDEPWRHGGQIEFEQHYFSFDDSNPDKDRVQVYNFMHQEYFLPADLAEVNRTQVYVRIFIQDDSRRSVLELKDPIPVKTYVGSQSLADNTKSKSWYDHGNSTIECMEDSCRFVGHVVFKHGTIGNPLGSFGGGGLISLDKGQTWFSDGDANSMGVVFERALIMGHDGDSIIYQGSNWGFDKLVAKEDVQDDPTVCWKVWVVDRDAALVTFVPMDGGYGGYQLSTYVRCFQVEFHDWS